ncbi:hypothetical protein QE152_g13287 [Popillia japonica]|uniref:Uncharacterized protein n=1 Tax=Popillia japonica TaxID=7064 RepID=A0AAW1LCN3_POPJA
MLPHNDPNQSARPFLTFTLSTVNAPTRSYSEIKRSFHYLTFVSAILKTGSILKVDNGAPAESKRQIYLPDMEMRFYKKRRVG